MVLRTQTIDRIVIQAVTAMFRAGVGNLCLGGYCGSLSVFPVEVIREDNRKDIANDGNAGCREFAFNRLPVLLKQAFTLLMIGK